jgi:hypothetical protein
MFSMQLLYRCKKLTRIFSFAILLSVILATCVSPSGSSLNGGTAYASGSDLLFIHHSIGRHWLYAGLDSALESKPYIGEVNDTYYDIDVENDPGRPDSLTGRTIDCPKNHEFLPGSCTDPHHWLFWLNDYLENMKHFDSPNNTYNPEVNNKIIMIKSGFHTNDIVGENDPAGIDPFKPARTTLPDDTYELTAYIDNYKAAYTRNPNASYTYQGYDYKPLDEVFAENPDTLFIVLTAPPFKLDGSANERQHNARIFNDWLANDWINSYFQNYGLRNVAVFHYFDFLANPETDYRNDPEGLQNRLKAEYGGWEDHHPSTEAHTEATEAFATGPDNFLDNAWNAFSNTLSAPTPTDSTNPSPTSTSAPTDTLLPTASEASPPTPTSAPTDKPSPSPTPTVTETSPPSTVSQSPSSLCLSPLALLLLFVVPAGIARRRPS